MLDIEQDKVQNSPDFGIPLFRLGFRPFFLGAGLFAIIAMALWMLSYLFAVNLDFAGMPASLWHAHEMLFGYTMAVVAGFLLTAIKNWTGVEVLRGTGLALLFSLWLLARIVLLSNVPLAIVAIVDCAFLLTLTAVCLRPVLMVKQYKQLGIISKLFLLFLCNVVFYLGITGVLVDGIRWGLYSALYMIIALILVMMRRVMPMFIQNGIDNDAGKKLELKNRLWLDNTSLVLLLCLWISDVFTAFDQVTAITAVALTVLHTVRLTGWYDNRVWKKPLVWVLVAAYMFIIAGFALKALSIYLGISSFLSVHAFTVGGVGLLTIGMMSRVSLGHTGRSVFEPPSVVFWIFLLMMLAALVRVVLPLLSIDLYVYWIGISQVLWMSAFILFVVVYAPMFLQARVDGRDG